MQISFSHTSHILKSYRTLLCIILLFAFTVSANLFWASNYHSDERFYTDSSIIMNMDGDYWNPKYFNGEARLNKPLITYWIIALSYKIFGINLFSSRLPFLLAGIGTLFITFLISYEWLKDTVLANFAVIIIASNWQILELSGRSTPDILLILSLSLAWYGLVQPNIKNISKKKAILGWIGVGLSIGIKGSIGVLFIFFLLITHAIRVKYYVQKSKLNEKIKLQSKKLFNAYGIVFGIIIIIAAFWPIILSFDLNTSTSQNPSFIEDQITNRPASSFYQVLENWGNYSFAPLRHFIPWSFILIYILLKKNYLIVKNKSFNLLSYKKIIFKLNRLPLNLVWFFTLVMTFSLGNIDHSRYLAPVYPMLAVSIASLIFHKLNYSSFKFFYTLGFISISLCALNFYLIQPKFNPSAEEKFIEKSMFENNIIDSQSTKQTLTVPISIKNIGLIRVLTHNKFNLIREQ